MWLLPKNHPERGRVLLLEAWLARPENTPLLINGIYPREGAKNSGGNRRDHLRGKNAVGYQHECRADTSAETEGLHEGQPHASVDHDTSFMREFFFSEE